MIRRSFAICLMVLTFPTAAVTLAEGGKATATVVLGDAFDANNPEQPYEVWARIKFEGPGFPHGDAGDKNAILVERVVLVK